MRYEQTHIRDHEEWLNFAKTAEGGICVMHGFAASEERGAGRMPIGDPNLVRRAVEQLRSGFGWPELARMIGRLATARRGPLHPVEGGWWLLLPVDYAEDLHDAEALEFRVRVLGKEVVLHVRELAERRSGAVTLPEFRYTSEFALVDGTVCIFDDHPDAPEVMESIGSLAEEVGRLASDPERFGPGAERAARGNPHPEPRPDKGATPRPLALQREYSDRYPKFWKAAGLLRAAKGQKEVGDWPEWCYLPMAGAGAIVCPKGRLAPRQVPEVATLAALIPWRATKGIYAFDADIMRELWGMPLEGELPIRPLFRLPEWCCYVEVPDGFEPPDPYRGLRGFFVHLEWCVNGRHPELRFVLDYGNRSAATFVNLTGPTLAACLRSSIEESMGNQGIPPEVAGQVMPDEFFGRMVAGLAGSIAPLVSVTLYLCAVNAEIVPADGSDRRPANPQPARGKKHRGRILGAQDPTRWNVAWRIGAALRRASVGAERPSPPGAAGDRKRPRPHVRRAHWKAYWTGPRDDPEKRKVVLRWLPPTGVNVKDAAGGDLPAVWRPVG